jgi:molybdopterin/thiamine biosynthesis adenylyltransferase
VSQVLVKIADSDFGELREHLLREDRDEHAAILLCGRASSARSEIMLVRETHLVRDRDFPPGDFGYRQIVPRVVAELSGRAADENLGYIAVHSHPLATKQNALSRDDLASHERLFPHLFDITQSPVGGMALGPETIAGEIWFSRDGARRRVDALHVIGAGRKVLRPKRHPSAAETEVRFDRQARLFGARGQQTLRELRVGVIGLGGGGSMITQQLAHLGIGQLVLVDFDVIEEINLNRIVGSLPEDAQSGTTKVEVAQRLIRNVDRSIQIDVINGDIGDLGVAEALRDVDFLFLATDTIGSRLVFNALVHRYLIPGIQVGAKVEPDSDSELDVYLAVRPVFPSSGCLHCHNLISPERLQAEARSPEERIGQNYVGAPDVVDPAVISLNGTTASWAVTTMLFYATRLGSASITDHRLFFPRAGDVHRIVDRRDPSCLFCGRYSGSHYAAGDPADRLPVRRGQRR